MSKTIRIACEGAAQLELDSLQPFQGDLKELSNEAYESLKNEILKTGFAFPFHVWRDGGINHLVGGHQRLRVLQKLKGLGYTVPALPVVYVDADDYAAAKRRVLQDASQYGRVSGEGLKQFVLDAGIDLADLVANFKLPDFSFPEFAGEFFPKPADPNDVGAPAAPIDPGRSMSNDVKMVQLYFDAPTHEKFSGYCRALGERFKTDNLTDTIFRSLEELHGNPSGN
jgi:hypothetical protein